MSFGLKGKCFRVNLPLSGFVLLLVVGLEERIEIGRWPKWFRRISRDRDVYFSGNVYRVFSTATSWLQEVVFLIMSRSRNTDCFLFGK